MEHQSPLKKELDGMHESQLRATGVATQLLVKRETADRHKLVALPPRWFGEIGGDLKKISVILVKGCI